MSNKKTPKEVSEYFRKLAEDGRTKKAAEARWAGHEKMTEEEKRAKKAAYQREWRKRKKANKTSTK